jgi:hypothetical protein
MQIKKKLVLNDHSVPHANEHYECQKFYAVVFQEGRNVDDLHFTLCTQAENCHFKKKRQDVHAQLMSGKTS